MLIHPYYSRAWCVLKLREFKDIVTYNYSIMLHALGDYQDLSISEHTPPVEDFLRPQISLRRPRKIVHGFMSMREHLADDHGPH